jgi:tetratricopeptide (TPR) repeat protein
MPEPIRKRLGEKTPAKPSTPLPSRGAAPDRRVPGAAPRPAGPRRGPPVPPGPADGSPPKKNKLVLYLALGGGAVGLIAVLAVAMSGGPTRRPERAEPAPENMVAVAPPPKKTPPVTEKGPSKTEIEDDFKKAAEQSKKFGEEQAKKTAEREKERREELARLEAEKTREKTEAEARVREELVAYETRKRERRSESAKRLEDAKKTIEEDRKADAARQKALVEKLKNLKLSLKLKNGLQLQNVVVQGMTRDEVKLAFTYEGSQAEQAFPIEFIDDRSYVEFLGAIYKGDGASGLYEKGRHLVLRKLWKDAKAAFDECVKADGAYSARVPDISRILNNEAAFRGSARRIGADQLFLTYDFSDAAQTQDFSVQQPGQMVVEGGELKLTARGTALWSLKDVDFERDLEVDAVVVFEEKSALVLGSFFNFERKGYLAVVNSQTPAGHVLHRFDGSAKIEQLAVQPAPKVTAGAEVRIRFQVRGGAFRVYVGDQEAVAVSDATYSKGWCLLGAAGGTIRVKKLTIQGRVNPVEIEKRFAEVEVLVRRALESDLGKKKSDESGVDPLSAEDEFLLARLDPSVRGDFEKKRSTFVQAVQKRRLLPAHLVLFDDIVQKAPDFAAGHYWRAAALIQGRRPDDAKDDMAAAVRLYPDFHEAHLALAQMAVEERDFPAAATSVRKALELSPGFSEAMAQGGFLKFLAGDSKGAVADLELARKLDPSSDTAATTQKNVLNVLKGPQHLGAKWVKEFPHYIVMTDMSPEKTALYGSRLEAAYKFYVETFKDVFTEDAKRPKPRVAIFNTREAYLTYGELTLSGRQEWTLGYFHPLYKELLLFEDVDPDATLQTLYHEAFHQFMSMMIARVPFWYNEGIAEYMGGIKIDVPKGGATKILERARILEGRLKGLKTSLNFALKFEDIMMQTPGQFYSGPVSFKYAQAWSMVHFFYEHEKGKYRPRIESYFKKLKEGGSPKEAYQSGFGDARMDELQKEWIEYVKRMEPPKK